MASGEAERALTQGSEFPPNPFFTRVTPTPTWEGESCGCEDPSGGGKDSWAASSWAAGRGALLLLALGDGEDRAGRGPGTTVPGCGR